MKHVLNSDAQIQRLRVDEPKKKFNLKERHLDVPNYSPAVTFSRNTRFPRSANRKIENQLINLAFRDPRIVFYGYGAVLLRALAEWLKCTYPDAAELIFRDPRMQIQIIN